MGSFLLRLWVDSFSTLRVGFFFVLMLRFLLCKARIEVEQWLFACLLACTNAIHFTSLFVLLLGPSSSLDHLISPVPRSTAGYGMRHSDVKIL